ncbi:ROK family transcriptional regulator [Phaeacidiphilus oryzae]|uniref:ROK family transcriptional regulator n=1 Tax=Phaeacidiphilus oryzae TaxID=348818 RepID=UPI00055C95A2|nr:ROK family transcriptional regulator [Phaeacidiphilus oryzae]
MGGTDRAAAGTPRLLRAINDRAALELLLEHGPLSRGQLGILTGLSKPTASQLLSRLESAGLVLPVGTTAAGRPGPAAQLYEINPGAGYVAGLDVNPKRILAAVADISGRVLGEEVLDTPGRQAPAPAAELTATAVDRACAAAGLDRSALCRVVVGTPGAVDPGTGKLRYAPHLAGWHSPRLVEELTGRLGLPTAVENDVNLAAVAEQRTGAASRVSDFVLLWAADGSGSGNEGIGAAVVVGGRLHRGHTGGAGEVGYMPVPGAPLIRNVRRANSGGFQELAGAGAVRALAREHGLGSGPAPRLVAKAADPASGPAGRAVLGELARRLATGLAAMVAVIDPELVVLSGGIAAAGGEPLRALVQEELAAMAVSAPRVAISAVDGSPVLVGALGSALESARESLFSASAAASG